MAKPISFRPAAHQVSLLDEMPDRTQFLRNAIDSYMLQKNDHQKMLEMLDQRLGRMAESLDVIHTLLTSKAIVVSKVTNENMTIVEPPSRLHDPGSDVAESKTKEQQEAEDAMAYFADSLDFT